MHELILFVLYLCIFLAGMAVLRIGLFNLSGESLKAFLSKVTNTPWKGFIVGTCITGILQSSAAVMVMTIGLVSAGSLTFPQTIGIILGSNIGSTLTAEFMTFSFDKWIVPGVISGALLCFVPKNVCKSIGISLIGLSAIFAAMSGFKQMAGPISSYSTVQTLTDSMDRNILIALLTGLVITAVIHSSSATIGISMSFLASDELTVYAAIAIMLGSNIGTCITGYMASFGSGNEARFTAYAHIWLNVLGVLAFIPFIHLLEDAAAHFTPDKATQLAHASVLFNVITSLIVLPFSRQFAKLIHIIHRPLKT
ncbi:Na/Pi cotransporter family protein [Peribacillus cavernae]|uniref:Na/Pi cotransporter family protein n=1 Tax=Peribacillus cavernae TaxID=1674310 RepID=A0A433HJQ9_9BACI|nr:Na/Pi symporter [Peribacillus cavernae]MDQ0218255.1 phosphate:Na+ symporter [Peribacillus cavernae]RUQ28459.1 Na/Pi cotransporter family protein [Peribacillus cavernae]